MATLTQLAAGHGYAAGVNSLDTSGYVGLISAFQKCYFCDGRDYDNYGYNKLDFLDTKIQGAGSGAFTIGEVVSQASSGAKGIYGECIDIKITGTITGTFTVGEQVSQETTGAIGYVAKANTETGAGKDVYIFPVSVYNTFETGDTTYTITGISSSATVESPTAVTSARSETAGAVGIYHFIYRTTTTEFATGADTITGATSKKTISTVSAVTAPPHWLPWSPFTGTMPDGGSNIGCLCFGRIFLNSMRNPHQWYCSRVFAPQDWDSSQTDVAAATYSQSAKAGEVGNPIVAMISYKDHYLIWGCADEIWLLQSDPLMGGVNRCLSKVTGIFSPTAFCWDDKNNLYFLGIDGIYILPSTAIINASPPENITKERNPKLISSLGLNRRTDRVAMEYDKNRYGIKVSITQQDGDWAVEWWLDLRTGGIFPETFASDQDAASLYYYDSYKSSERGLLIGCYDGYIRKEDEGEKDDDGNNAIESHVVIGPIVADGEPRNKVGINETSLVLGEESDGVTVDFHNGTSADEVVANVNTEETPLITKTLSGDSLKNSITDRVSGRAVAVKLKNTTNDETFSVEEINLTLLSEGRKK